MTDRRVGIDVEVNNKTDKGLNSAKKSLNEFEKYTKKIGDSIVGKFIGAEAIIGATKKVADFAIGGIKDFAKATGDKSFEKFNTVMKTVQQQIGKQLLPIFHSFADFLSKNLNTILQVTIGIIDSLVATFKILYNAIEIIIDAILILGTQIVKNWITPIKIAISTMTSLVNAVPENLVPEGWKKGLNDANDKIKEIDNNLTDFQKNRANNIVKNAKKLGKAAVDFGKAVTGKSGIPIKTVVEVDEKALEEAKKKNQKELEDMLIGFNTVNNKILEGIDYNKWVELVRKIGEKNVETLENYTKSISNKTLNELINIENNNNKFLEKKKYLLSEMKRLGDDSEKIKAVEKEILLNEEFNKILEKRKILEKQIEDVKSQIMLEDISIATTGTPKEKAIHSRTRELSSSLENVNKEISDEEKKFVIMKELTKQYNQDINKIEKDFAEERFSILKDYSFRELKLKGNALEISLNENQINFDEQYKQLEASGLKGIEYITAANILADELRQADFQSVMDYTIAQAEQYNQMYTQIASTIQNFSNVQTENRIKDIDRQYNKEKEAINSSIMSNKKKAKEMEKLDKETAKKKEEEQRKAFNRNKAFNIATALMDGGLASMRVWAGTGTPYEKIAWQIVVAATTAASVATIAAQKFAKGGIVGGNSITGDNVTARVNSGEMILNKQQQARLFAIANGNGGSGKNINISMDTVIQGNVDSNTLEKLNERDQANREYFKRQLRQLQYDGVLANGVLV